jgi:putative hydrolases of HD superfamily
MIETLIELQRLKRLDRTGWPLRGLPPGTESVGAHTFGVATVAMFLADAFSENGIQVDVLKVLRMSLLHDLSEARTGDLPRIAEKYFSSEVKKQAERAAFRDIIEPLGSQSDLYNSLHDEYMQRETLESRVVKAADIIDLLVQITLFERSGVTGLDEFWEGARDYDFRLEGKAAEIVNDIVGKLLTTRSRR